MYWARLTILANAVIRAHGKGRKGVFVLDHLGSGVPALRYKFKS